MNTNTNIWTVIREYEYEYKYLSHTKPKINMLLYMRGFYGFWFTICWLIQIPIYIWFPCLCCCHARGGAKLGQLLSFFFRFWGGRRLVSKGRLRCAWRLVCLSCVVAWRLVAFLWVLVSDLAPLLLMCWWVPSFPAAAFCPSRTWFWCWCANRWQGACRPWWSVD